MTIYAGEQDGQLRETCDIQKVYTAFTRSLQSRTITSRIAISIIIISIDRREEGRTAEGRRKTRTSAGGERRKSNASFRRPQGKGQQRGGRKNRQQLRAMRARRGNVHPVDVIGTTVVLFVFLV